MNDRVGLVLGATGITGNALVRHLSAAGWSVLAASRRPIPASENVIPLSIDLTDKSAVEAALASYSVTHVFFAAYISPFHTASPGDYRTMRRILRMLGAVAPFMELSPALSKWFYAQLARGGLAYDPEQLNLRMLRNVVEATRAAPHRLSHVSLVTGGKIYGMHYSPHIYRYWRQPFREDDRRPPGPNFYYEQEDYLQEMGEHSEITWSVVRPAFLIGDNPNAAFNLLIGLAVYASILKATGRPLIFPGDARAADCLFEMSDADLVAEMMEWSSLTPAAHNQAFNAVNGTPMRWRDIWPAMAAYFGMESEFHPKGFSARPVFQEGAAVWEKLVQTHNLEANPLSKLVPDSIFDLVMLQDWDTIFAMDKARQFGFTHEVDHMDMFSRHFQHLRDNRIIP